MVPLMVCLSGSVRIASDKPVSNRRAVIHVGLVDECHRQATWCFDPVDPELDPSSCRNARAAPSTRAGRERGRDGTGRALAFPSKKRTSCGSGWLLIALPGVSSSPILKQHMVLKLIFKY